MNANDLAKEVVEYVDDATRVFLMSKDSKDDLSYAYSSGCYMGLLNMFFTEMTEEGRERVSNMLKIFREGSEKKAD
jgi:hypothetical protein